MRNVWLEGRMLFVFRWVSDSWKVNSSRESPVSPNHIFLRSKTADSWPTTSSCNLVVDSHFFRLNFSRALSAIDLASAALIESDTQTYANLYTLDEPDIKRICLYLFLYLFISFLFADFNLKQNLKKSFIETAL